MDKIRRLVFDSLLRMETEDKFANLELNATLNREGLSDVDRGFYTRLFYGVIERKISLDTLISAFCDRDRKKIEQKVQILLRMGLYQILFMDGVPDHAAVNETVDLSKAVCHAGVSGFVNGILRRAIREKDALPLPKEGSVERVSMDSALPIWLVQMWREQYGEIGDDIARSSCRIPPITLRVNTLKTTREALIASLAARGIESQPTEYTQGVRLARAYPILAIREIEEGLCFVQDEASQICALALGAKKGQNVLDVCACPGGKSFSIAIGMENEGILISRDVHESKLSLIESGALRLGIDMISTQVRDGRVENPEDCEKFDCVLCDVPCSGLGVIAKKPDLRHKKKEEIDRLPEIQYAILSKSANAVKRGGVLLYSTCTLNKKENEEVADRFLLENPEFIPCTEDMPNGSDRITFFPCNGESDGFFLAKFKRKA